MSFAFYLMHGFIWGHHVAFHFLLARLLLREGFASLSRFPVEMDSKSVLLLFGLSLPIIQSKAISLIIIASYATFHVCYMSFMS